jgi:hypothetical protein
MWLYDKAKNAANNLVIEATKKLTSAPTSDQFR